MLYKEKEYIPKSSEHYYTSFCTDNIGKKYSQWIVPVRVLGVSPAEYVRTLVQDFNAIVLYNKDNVFVSHYWKNQVDETKWRNYINKISKEKNFQI